MIYYIAIGVIAFIPAYIFLINPWIKRIYYWFKPIYTINFKYDGGLNQNRKILVQTNVNNIDLKVGYYQLGGIFCYTSIPVVNGQAIIETFLGKNGTTFVFIASHPISGSTMLLDTNDKRTPTVSKKGYFWQKIF